MAGVVASDVNPWGLPAGDLTDGVGFAAADLRRWAGAEILMTGATGFLGSWCLSSMLVANEVLSLGLRITVISRNPGATPLRAGHNLRVVQADVRSLDRKIGRPDLIVHGAADTVSGPRLREAIDLASSIVEGTARVLDLASAAGARVLHLSSGAVYGPRPSAPTSESHPSLVCPLSPAQVYTTAKALAESLCSTAAEQEGTEIVIARLFAFVGPRIPLDAHFAAGSFLSDALHRRPVTVAGDGRPVRSYLYAGDFPEWCWALATRGASGRAYNVGSPHPITIADLALEVAGLVKPALGVEIRGRASAGQPHTYLPDTSLAAQELSLTPRTDLREALRRTFSWYSGS